MFVYVFLCQEKMTHFSTVASFFFFLFFFLEVCDLCSGAGACLPVRSLERRRKGGECSHGRTAAQTGLLSVSKRLKCTSHIGKQHFLHMNE